MIRPLIIPSIKYAWLTIKHKWFVLRAGLVLKVPLWRLLIHDLSKFRPSELPHYGRQFFGPADHPRGFMCCWLRHQNRNPHHWEYWVPRTGCNRCSPIYPNNEPIFMPGWAMREMVADWAGACRAYEGHWPSREVLAGKKVWHWKWLEEHFPTKMQLDPITRATIRDALDLLFRSNLCKFRWQE